MRTCSRIVAILALGTACVFATMAQAADVAEDGPAMLLGAPFGDHAVLQQQMAVPVWGWSAPGTTVTVTFAGQEKSAVAGQDGKWMLALDPLTASFDPAEMMIEDEKGNRVTLQNILVGEVWLASGQSNMQWLVGKSSAARELEVAPRNGVIPIREFQVSSVTAQLHPIEKAEGAWKHGDYSQYSAIAFSFAHKLLEELEVPIGILNGSFSQTSIQAWVPRVGFRDGKDAYTQAIYQKILETDPSTPEHKQAWKQYYAELEAGIAENAARVARGEAAVEVTAERPGNLQGNRDASWLFNARVSPLVPYAIRGAIWNQGYANMGEGIVYYNNLHSLIRGWRLVWDRPELPVYFHQFYTPGKPASPHPTTGSTSEMRLGTLMARDIPHTGMASQIDVGGAIHYGQKVVPGRRLARHALKNQYGKSVVTDGPIFKSYTVKGNKLIVSFDHADGGLVVAEPNYKGILQPEVLEDGTDSVDLFYLADADRVWHPAKVAIDGDQVILTAEGVEEPHGVSYAAGGVGAQPNLYNQAMLPMTPFVYYDHERVLASNWPDQPLKIAGYAPDESKYGASYDYRRMPLLSTQFRDDAILQAGVPVTIWGGLGMDTWREARNDGKILFRFGPADGDAASMIEKTIPVEPGMEEWQVTVPPKEAGSQPYTLYVAFVLDGEVVHERSIENMVFGDVFYVAAPAVEFDVPDVERVDGAVVRVMQRKAKRDSNRSESRFSIAVSTAPENRFAAVWQEAQDGLAAALGHRIAAKTGNPVGIIFMQSSSPDIGLASWIPVAALRHAPSTLRDYAILSSKFPWSDLYAERIRQYIAEYKTYWNEYIPEMIATKAVPNGSNWGQIPHPRPTVEGTSAASETWNVMTASFTPTALKGIIFLSGPGYVSDDGGATFGPEFSALATSWKKRFGGEDVPFIYTLPGKALAPELSKPSAIEGPSHAVMISEWEDVSGVLDAIVKILE